MNIHKIYEKDGYYYYYLDSHNYLIKMDRFGSHVFENRCHQDSREKLPESIDLEETQRAQEELDYLLQNKKESDSDIKPRQNVIIDYGQSSAPIEDIRIASTLDCNLKCHYCTQREYVRGIKGLKMDKDIANKVVDFITNNRIGQTLQIKFYGGEPFLNFSAVEFIVENLTKCLSGKHILQFSTTTNGLLLNDKIADFIIKYNFNVAVSLDGPAALHDKNRTYKNGQGTFNKVFRNIEKIKKMDDVYFRKNLTILATIDSESFNDYKQATDFFADSDLPYDIKIHWVVKKTGMDFINENILKDITYNIINHRYKYVPFFSFMTKIDRVRLDKANLTDLEVRPCGAGIKILAISPLGDIYPCEQFLDRSIGKIGSISTGVDKNLVANMHFALNNKIKQCLDCWAMRFCPYNCFFWRLHSKHNYCIPIGKQTEDMMRIYTELAEKNPASYVGLTSFWYERSQNIYKNEYCNS